MKMLQQNSLYNEIFFFQFIYWRFCLGPLLILICSYAIPAYERQSTDFIIQSILTLLGHGFFFVITLPAKNNYFFPYHVKTHKVGLIVVSSRKNAEVIENFPHHKENEGGNIEFEQLRLSSLLKTSNREKLYEISTMTELE